MTQVDFYVLAGDSNDSRLRMACRITEKAMQHRQHVYVNSTDAAEAAKLDELLWTFSQGSFIPHRVVTKALTQPPEEPVLIGVELPPRCESSIESLGGNWDVMINLAAEVPDCFSRFARVVEVIDANPARREQGRAHYRYYRDRGYKLKTHKV